MWRCRAKCWPSSGQSAPRYVLFCTSYIYSNAPYSWNSVRVILKHWLSNNTNWHSDAHKFQTHRMTVYGWGITCTYNYWNWLKIRTCFFFLFFFLIFFIIFFCFVCLFIFGLLAKVSGLIKRFWNVLWETICDPPRENQA